MAHAPSPVGLPRVTSTSDFHEFSQLQVKLKGWFKCPICGSQGNGGWPLPPLNTYVCVGATRSWSCSHYIAECNIGSDFEKVTTFVVTRHARALAAVLGVMPHSPFQPPTSNLQTAKEDWNILHRILAEPQHGKKSRALNNNVFPLHEDNIVRIIAFFIFGKTASPSDPSMVIRAHSIHWQIGQRWT